MVRQLLEKLKASTDLAKLGPVGNYGLFVPRESGSLSGDWLDLESPLGKYATQGIVKSGVRSHTSMTCL